MRQFVMGNQTIQAYLDVASSDAIRSIALGCEWIAGYSAKAAASCAFCLNPKLRERDNDPDAIYYGDIAYRYAVGGNELFQASEPTIFDRSVLEEEDQADAICMAGRDGECTWISCPQIRDNEPRRSGRHCPLDMEKRDAI